MQRQLVRSKVILVGLVVGLVLTVAVFQLQAADAAPEDSRLRQQLAAQCAQIAVWGGNIEVPDDMRE